MPEPGAEDLGFELLPADDAAPTPEEEVEEAVASALAPDYVALPGEAPEPLGKTWLFDFAERRMVMRGQAPAEATGEAAIQVWCLTALHSAQYAHAIFSDAFGTERAGDPIGDVDVPPLIRDYEARLRAALTVHDRIDDVTDFDADWDPATGVLVVHQFHVVLDDETALAVVGPFDLRPEEEA